MGGCAWETDTGLEHLLKTPLTVLQVGPFTGAGLTAAGVEQLRKLPLTDLDLAGYNPPGNIAWRTPLDTPAPNTEEPQRSSKVSDACLEALKGLQLTRL